jgi:hypothetical protein
MGICPHGTEIFPANVKAPDSEQFGAVRYRNFSNGPGADVFLSQTVLTLGTGPRVERNIVWAESNPFTFSYNAAAGQIMTTVGGQTLMFPTIANSNFDVIQMFIRNRAPAGGQVLVTGLTLNGVPLPGTFTGGTEDTQFDIICDLKDADGNFTLSGTILLIGPQSTSQEASRVEFLVADNFL